MPPIALPMALGPPLAKADFLATSAPAHFGEGFYPEEREGSDPFRWMSNRGRLHFDPQPLERDLELQVFCQFGDLSQTLTAHAGTASEELSLVHGWWSLSLPVPAGADAVVLEANKLFPPAYYPGDTRQLGVRVRRLRLHADPVRHQNIRRHWANAVLNTREMIQGKTVLESMPPSLGIDLHGACNVKPPCVYCEWNFAKEEEAENVDRPFTADTLREWGPFFDHAGKLVNCSIGEPFMMKPIDDILDLLGDRGKTLEMSTNGQILTDRNIEKLLGRYIHLYISLDAATLETYRKLRNDTFEKILGNLRRLLQARKGHGGLPKVFLVFMPMKVNVHELDDFVRLTAELGADKLILRPLNTAPGNNLDWERGGYHFRYDDEILPFGELVHVSGRARELCRRHGVDLSDQLDFGGAMEQMFQDEYREGEREATTALSAAASAPAPDPTPPAPAEPPATTPEIDVPNPSLGFEQWPDCTEPWRDLYILRRGIRPCCYGGASLGGIEDYAKAWNSPTVQGIREHLSRGSFHDYCLLSPACPIVRKSEHAHTLPARHKRLWMMWRAWQKLNAWTGGIPRRALRRLRRGH